MPGHDGLVGAGIGAGTALDARIGDGKPWRLESRTAPGEALAEDLVVAVHHVEVVIVQLAPSGMQHEHAGLGILVDVVYGDVELRVCRCLLGHFLGRKQAHIPGDAHHEAWLEMRHVVVIPATGRGGFLAANGQLATFHKLAVEGLHVHGAQVEALLVAGKEVRDAGINAAAPIEGGEAAAADLVEQVVDFGDGEHEAPFLRSANLWRCAACGSGRPALGRRRP